MTARADSLLTVRWRDRSFVLRAPKQVEELARRLRQKGLGNIAVLTVQAVVEGKTSYEKALSDEERKSVCSVLTETESDPALRRAFNLLCAPRRSHHPDSRMRSPDSPAGVIDAENLVRTASRVRRSGAVE